VDLKIENIREGAVVEELNRLITEAVFSIFDPNTDAKAKRVISMKMSMKPNEQRTMAIIDVTCDIKLPGRQPFVTAVSVGQDLVTGEVDAVEPKQGKIFDSKGAGVESDMSMETAGRGELRAFN